MLNRRYTWCRLPVQRKTPQEKKRLSLERDRRNVYGEAPHASRKNVPLRKKLRNRANRRAQESQLPSVPTPIDNELMEDIEAKIRQKAPPIWEKYPDAPLGEVIARKEAKRTSKVDRAKACQRALRILKELKLNDDPSLESFVLQEVRSGRYRTPEDAVRDAIAHWEPRKRNGSRRQPH